MKHSHKMAFGIVFHAALLFVSCQRAGKKCEKHQA